MEITKKVVEQKKQNEAEAERLLSSIDDYLLKELGIVLPEKDNSLENRIFTTPFYKVSGKRFDCDYYSVHYSELEESVENCNYSTSKLESFVSNIAGGKTPTSSKYSEEKTNFPIIKVGSYTNEFIDLTKVDYTFFQNSLVAQKGDIFILSAAHQAEYVGRHIKFLKEAPSIPTAYVGELICIRVDESKFNSMYLFSLLNTDLFKTLINREKTGQTSHVYGKDIKYIRVPSPPLEKQKEIANHITAIRQQAQQLKDKTKEALEQASKMIENILIGD
ncbi:MAG: restriction endonuclease subunit S [Bacteroidales bacterium]|nr:restriction endonuclease subunit S [Bacteroidales bacterium]